MSPLPSWHRGKHADKPGRYRKTYLSLYLPVSSRTTAVPVLLEYFSLYLPIQSLIRKNSRAQAANRQGPGGGSDYDSVSCRGFLLFLPSLSRKKPAAARTAPMTIKMIPVFRSSAPVGEMPSMYTFVKEVG